MTDLNTHQAAVLEIANKVDELVMKPAIKARFVTYIDHLYKMVEDYGQAQEPYAEKLEKAGREIEERSAKGEFPPGTEISLVEECPPPKDYVKMNYDDNFWVNIPMSVIYRPHEPVNPLLWFGIKGNANLQREAREDEKLMCEYVVLAIIHDYELRQSTDRPIFSKKYAGKWFQRDLFRRDVAAYYFYIGQTYQYRQIREQDCHNRLSRIKRTFVHVQADLRRQPPEKPTKPSGETKSDEKGVLEPKPPEILQKILWVLKYGRRYWWLILLAILLMLCLTILPRFI